MRTSETELGKERAASAWHPLLETVSFLYEIAWYVFVSAWVIVRWLRRDAERHADIAERLGYVPVRPEASDRSIWIHAVSVGEILSVRPVIDEIKRRSPSSWVLLTTSNAAAFAMATRHPTGADALCRTPWDARFAVRRALDRARPDVLAIVECEIWPNLIRDAAARGCDVQMINARIYAKDFNRYRAARFVFRPVLECLSGIHTQSSADLDRFIALGAPAARVREGGNCKFDACPATRDPNLPSELRDKLRLTGRVIWIWASTHENEEEQILSQMADAWDRIPGLAVLVAPRDITRADRIERLCADAGKRSVRRSRPSSTSTEPYDVLILDTLGELSRMFAVADVVFVGGTLAPRGGHNPIEPAAWSKPIVMGPSVYNFADIVEVFERAGGLLRRPDTPGVVATSIDLLENPERGGILGKANEDVLARHRGVAAQYAQLLLGVAEARRAA